jgi:DNA modification methylase
MPINVLCGDCRTLLAGLEADSFAACVTDPPYHLTTDKRGGIGIASLNVSSPAGRSRISTGFMGTIWDGGDVAFRPETWAAVYRVLKPGAHLVAFGGTRTYHRLACAIEDAGFEIRDQLAWMYASGFPKSLDVSKAIDRAAGAERDVVGELISRFKEPYEQRRVAYGTFKPDVNDDGYSTRLVTAPASEAARQWQGWGTALKPAWEPIVLARKPLSEGTVAANVLRWGTGAINVDACRVTASRVDIAAAARPVRNNLKMFVGDGAGRGDSRHDMSAGRWPANVAHDGSPEVLEAFARFGERGGTATYQRSTAETLKANGWGHANPKQQHGFGDTGTTSRFFFCAKARPYEREGSHPTVKPGALMEWLVNLVTPPGGAVLDPFCGTGSTLAACDWLGLDATGIDEDPSTCADAERKVRRLRARRMIGDSPPASPSPGQLDLWPVL